MTRASATQRLTWDEIIYGFQNMSICFYIILKYVNTYFIMFLKICQYIFWYVFENVNSKFFMWKKYYITKKKYVKYAKIKRWQLWSEKSILNYYAYLLYYFKIYNNFYEFFSPMLEISHMYIYIYIKFFHSRYIFYFNIYYIYNNISYTS